MDFPKMYPIRQVFEAPSIPNVTAEIRKQVVQLGLGKRVRPGQSVAITAGSRGIHGYVTILSTLVECLRELQLVPCIIPAMGSHGGATAEGQVKLLAELGVTEASVGAPIVSNMDVVSVGPVDTGAEVWIARDVLKIDHLVICNRVKMHTAFHGEVESGLCKMLVVGCGKHAGALNMHKYGLAESIVPAAELLLKKAPVLFGLAILENAEEKTSEVRAVPPERFVETDRELLESARNLLPRLPVDDLDVLIVDEMGKEISGSGMDPNVVGFWRRDGGPRKPDYRTLILLDLTTASEGNALGIGLADLTTRRVIEKIDRAITCANVLTTRIWRSARIPMALENDRTVLEAALSGVTDLKALRMIRIVNTLKLNCFWATEALLPELRRKRGVVVEEASLKLEFDPNARLLPFTGCC
jgi:hypothetical protein